MPGDRKQRWLFDVPPLYFALAIILIFLLHRFLPLVDLIGPPVSHVGYLLIIGGVGLAAWGRWCFARAGTNVVPFAPSTALVMDGPFRITRNPMYLGMVIVLSGCFFLTGGLSGLLVIAAFFWWIHSHFVLPEENHMAEHFGEAYETFKSRTRRWL